MNEAAAERPNPVALFRHELNGMEDQFRAGLPAHIPVERFLRVVMTAVQTNPELLECDRRSVWNAAMRAAQDGLLPDGREGAMVVRRDSQRGKVANWQPMILGIRKKARNSGEISSWDAHIVCEGDAFEFQLGDAPQINHTYNLQTVRGKIVGAYSVAILKDGTKSYEVMAIADIYKIRDRSDAWKAYKAGKIKSTPWASDEGEMARKTVARRHSKVLPMSSDLDDLLRRDDELYDFDREKDGEDKVEAPRKRPRSLAHRLDAIAAPTAAPDEQAPPPAAAPPPHDIETGEVIEDIVEESDEAPAAEPPPAATPPNDPGPPVKTSDEKGRLRAYHKALEGALSMEKLSKTSATFWKENPPAEGSALANGQAAILGAHARRLKGEGSIADADHVAKQWIGTGTA